jgi:Mn2+/Fe2+ NRAMP family transporter
MSQPVPAPRDWLGIARQLGPGLILSAVIVGSGELIVTPKLGADVGFSLLWFIVLGCVLKVFVQLELGRSAVARGMTTLELMNEMPGPRWRVSWLLWLWLLMYIALVFQVAGMVGGLASIFGIAGLGFPTPWLAVATGASCAVLLVVGRYRLVESLSTVLVGLFTLATITAVVLLQSTPYAITASQIADGLSFQLPPSFNTAFAAFGIIGVGASELIYYPYWCLEKGYARNVGPADGSSGWFERARGWLGVMQIDAWLCFGLYTFTTIAFYLLGAAILHAQGLVVDDARMISTLSRMYEETFGPWSLGLFLVGAFAVLYSTVFGATASNARLFADALQIFGLAKYAADEDRARMVSVGCVLLPIAYTSVYLIVGAPVSLVFVGALAQALMLPFLALTALHLRFRRTPSELRPGLLWTTLLCLASLAMAVAGAYQVFQQIARLFG